MKKEITQKEIRKMTGKCRWCVKRKVDWFCPTCWWGVCDECIDGESDQAFGDRCFNCMQKAAKEVDMLGDIGIFKP